MSDFRRDTIYALPVIVLLGSLSDSCCSSACGMLIDYSMAQEAAFSFRNVCGHLSSASALLSKIPLYTLQSSQSLVCLPKVGHYFV